MQKKTNKKTRCS